MCANPKSGFCVVATVFFASCAIPDDERCGDDFFYDEETKSCKQTTPADTGDDTEEEDGGPQDSGADDAGDAISTGMGEYCESDEDCAGYDADFCALDPFTQAGGCTIKNCIEEPDNCPPGWVCCNFPDGFMYPDICMPESRYDIYGPTACTG